MILVKVEWEPDDDDDQSLPDPVQSVPQQIYDEGMTSWDDPVSEYLSDHTGYLVRDWSYVGPGTEAGD